jgi:hypothetical protein
LVVTAAHFHTLSERLDMDGLETLLLCLGLERSDLKGLTRLAKGRQLVMYCLRRSRIGEHLEIGQSMRQHIGWDSLRSS